MSELMPQPDDVVGNFRIVRQIGKGGMGAVFEALDLQTSKSVAIKVLHARFSGDPEALARFLNEGRAMAAVSHPGIVRVLGTGQLGDSGACYIAMEYLRGETLGVRLKRSGRLRREALLIGKQIADALVAAHKKNIIHRDLKPSNIILVDGDEDAAGHDNVKIIDFGIAKLPVDEQQEQDFRTRTGTMIGTPVYMAPEQCRGVTVTDRTDVYALGVILYQAMAGKPPFFSQADGDILAMHILVPPRPLKEVEPTVPAPVSTLIGRMLEKNGADRPSISEVASELARLAETPDWSEEPPASATTPAIPLTPIAQLPSTVDQFTDLRLSSQPTPSALGSGVSGQQRTGTSFTRARQTLALLLAFGVVAFSLIGALWVRSTQKPQLVSGPQAKRPSELPAVQPKPVAVVPPPEVPPPTFAPKPIVEKKTRWSIQSQPPGATVFLPNGTALGETPWVYEQPQQPGTTTVLLRKPGYRETTLELSQSSDEERAAELVLLAAPTSGKNPAARQLAKRPKRTGTQAGVKTNDLLIDFKSGKKLGGR